jgi:hypothetical protein
LGLFKTVEDITPQKLAMMQWLNPNNLTNNPNITLQAPTYTQTDSMYKMGHASMAFSNFPEVIFYIGDGTGIDSGLTLD